VGRGRAGGEICVHIADGMNLVPTVPTVCVTDRFPALRRTGAACAGVEGVFDPLADEVLAGVDAVQVRVVQDSDAIARPGGWGR
jgi:hypothetical protein